MKFGVCASIDQAQIAYNVGFDYLECTVESLKPEKSKQEIKGVLTKFSESPIPVETFNIFIPRDLKVTGESVDYDRIHRYLEKSLERVSDVGGDTIVFGSGGARTINEGFSKERAEHQIIHFLDIVADYAEPLGVTIVIEPLYKKASNMIKNLPEAVEIAKQVNRQSIKVLADFFHMVEENDPLENIIKYSDDIRHIHTSDNYYPPGSGTYPFPYFVECIKHSNYNGRVSIECIWNDFEKEVKDALAFVKSQFHSLET